MGLMEDLRLLSEQVRKRLANVRGEQATKQALVMPFFQVLGYDIYDPAEVHPEYVADFAKKRPGGPAEKVDYALHVNGEPAIFVECKPADAEPGDYDAQLARYFNATPSVKIAVLTNGVKYRFFTDLHSPNVIDPTPFFEFDLLSFGEREAENLKPFTKQGFNPSVVQAYAEEIIFVGKVTSLVNDVLRNPSENFVRFLLGELNLVSGRVTAKVVERFQPIVKKAVQTTLLDMMTKGLQQEIAQGEPVAVQPAAAAVAPAVVPVVAGNEIKVVAEGGAAEEGSRVVTTAEEMEIFEAVKRICAESAVKSELGYKDTITYFGINLGRVQKWFLRVFSNGARKSIVTRVPVEQAAMLARGFEVDAPAEGLGKSRVYFGGARDVDKLRALVLMAYEEEVRRGDASAEPISGDGS